VPKTATSAERIRGYHGPAILGFGFRPFFLSAAIWAAVSMLLWITALSGWLSLPIQISAMDWHAHELLFGFLPAALAGFLLTAIPNWTGRLPVTGSRLLLLVLVWWLGRAAMLSSAFVGAGAASALDLFFLVSLIFVAGREVLAGKNRRNFRVLLLVALLWVANLLFHLEAAEGYAGGGYGLRRGLSSALLLITLIGGRVVPSFTRNWLAKRGAGALPAAFGRFDGAVILVSATALLLWIALPQAWLTGTACLLAGALQLLRLARWRSLRTGAEPLVWILHLAYLFVPLGFVALGLCLLDASLLQVSAALHLWTAGAIGLMTLAVMTRASLGHSGRPLKASSAVLLIYLSAFGAVMARFLFGVIPDAYWLITLSGLLWICCFTLFIAVFFPLLALRRS
jgi:uncharacterized protein involved in response to NO